MLRSLRNALIAAAALPAALAAQGTSPIRPVATYSIVARDSATGEIGVAVQSHWFSVGAAVPWAEAGVGAVATQSFSEPAYGPLGLELIRMGRSAPEALRALVSTDPDSAVRQVAMVDARGRVAGYTGNRNIISASNVTGPQFSVQANMMDRSTVPQAMARAFQAAKGDLAERLMQALEAAQGEGGDIRGRQSAAMIVVGPTNTGKPWNDRLVDLRVEDNPEPLTELRRLITLSRLYRKLNEGDAAVTRNDMTAAAAAYGAATSILPDAATNGEAVFWTGISFASAGRVDDAMPYLRRAYAVHPRWAELVRRLPASGLLPNDPALIDRLVTGMSAPRR
jgi:uncharacterized Ntn-hydrolase superfamily protein